MMLNLIDKYRLIIGIVLVAVILVSGGILVGMNLKNSPSINSGSSADASTTSTSSSFLSSSPSSTALAKSAAKSASPAAAQVSGKININTATLSQLDGLPGIGPAYAQRIIDYRAANGPFKSVDGLDKVKGIGPKTIEKLRDKATVE